MSSKLHNTKELASYTTDLVVGVGIISHNNRYLLCQRLCNIDLYPSYWEFPGGKQERNESIEETITRELFEELNLRCTVGCLLGKFHWQYSSFSVTLICHLITVDDISSLCLNVHADIMWCPLQNLLNYNILPSNKQIIKALQASA